MQILLRESCATLSFDLTDIRSIMLYDGLECFPAPRIPYTPDRVRGLIPFGEKYQGGMKMRSKRLFAAILALVMMFSVISPAASAVEVGKNLIVVPYWDAENTNGRTPIVLDPGLTFGTGAHPSTQMVMEAMEELVTPEYRCLDLGSGSGILSIAALRLGAQSAIGVDIDPKAEDIARENAAYNGFAAPAFTALTGNVTEDKDMMDSLCASEYDLVLVNIVADVIIGLSPVLPNFLTERSTLICSGILDVRLPDVLAALEAAGLTVTATYEKEDWRCVTAKKM